MQAVHAIDEFYNMDDAVSKLDAITKTCIERTKTKSSVHQLADLKWTDLNVKEFENPKTWRMCQYVERSGGMVEANIRVQGILVEKELPPINVNSSNTNTMRRSRKYLRQHAKVVGGNSNHFAEAVSSVEYAFVCFTNHFTDNALEAWETPNWQGKDSIAASTRYFSHRDQYPGSSSVPFGEYVDPNGNLTQLMGSDFVHGPDNKVEYMEAVEDNGITRYRAVSPTAFKIGDIVEMVISILCHSLGKGKGYRMRLALRGLSLMDQSERDKAAVLRMRSRHIHRMRSTGTELKRRSAYDDEEEEEGEYQHKMARMSLD